MEERRVCNESCKVHNGACTIMTAPDIGVGWTVHVVPRKKDPRVEDKFYFSPTGEKFRSCVAVQRHLQQNPFATSPPRRNRETSQTESVQNDGSDLSVIEEVESVTGKTDKSGEVPQREGLPS